MVRNCVYSNRKNNCSKQLSNTLTQTDVDFDVTITLVCLKTAWDLPADPAANRQHRLHSQIKREHCMSFRRSLSTLKLIWCVIYLASEKYTVSYAYFTR